MYENSQFKENSQLKILVIKYLILNILLSISTNLHSELLAPMSLLFILISLILCNRIKVIDFKSFFKTLVVITVQMILVIFLLFIIENTSGVILISIFFLISLISNLSYILNNYLRTKRINFKGLIDITHYDESDKVKNLTESFKNFCINFYILNSNQINAHVLYINAKYNIILTSQVFNVLNSNELSSIIYHEIGHEKLHHNLWLNVFRVLLGAFFISICFVLILFYRTEYYSIISFYLFVIVVLDSLKLFITYISNFMLRNQEYNADKYSASIYSKEHLLHALFKLNTYANLKIGTGLYAAIYNSYPSFESRISKINNLKS